MTPVKVKFRGPASPPTRQIPPEGVKLCLLHPDPQRNPLQRKTNHSLPKPIPRMRTLSYAAYQIHIERGGTYGHDVDDWLQAQRELFEKYANTSRNDESGDGINPRRSPSRAERREGKYEWLPRNAKRGT